MLSPTNRAADTSTLLKAAQLTHPGRKWRISHTGRVVTGKTAGIWYPDDEHEVTEFNPHDPTKGDLAALNQKLEEAGWEFWYFKPTETFLAFHNIYDTYEAKTPAERALKCVGCMNV